MRAIGYTTRCFWRSLCFVLCPLPPDGAALLGALCSELLCYVLSATCFFVRCSLLRASLLGALWYGHFGRCLLLRDIADLRRLKTHYPEHIDLYLRSSKRSLHALLSIQTCVRCPFHQSHRPVGSPSFSHTI